MCYLIETECKHNTEISSLNVSFYVHVEMRMTYIANEINAIIIVFKYFFLFSQFGHRLAVGPRPVAFPMGNLIAPLVHNSSVCRRVDCASTCMYIYQ